MSRVRLQLPPFLFLFLLLLQKTAAADDSQATEQYCKPSSCGEIPIIKSPFRLTTDPGGCRETKFNLSCENNTTVLYESFTGGRYYVKAINYNNSTIRLVDDGVVSGNCPSLPTHPISSRRIVMSDGITGEDVSQWFVLPEGNLVTLYGGKTLTQALAVINCDNHVVHSTTTTTRSPLVVVETSPCVGSETNSSSSSFTSYVVMGRDASVSDLPESCRVELSVCCFFFLFNEGSDNLIRSIQLGAVSISAQFIKNWRLAFGKQDTIMNAAYSVLRIIDIVILYRLILLVLGTPVVIALLVYKWRTKHRSAYHSIEEFLRNQTHLMPVRYSYYHIKKITAGFKVKLGQGGFGSVYKAKLRSGSSAAVKMLATNNKNKPSATAAGGKGQDFMNEVATIGRIHHANVVRLIGYCSDGPKQALVYEFMPNGSLDKHISHHKDGGGGGDQCNTTPSLSLEQLYRISLGVGRGIEYLHSGCDMQILHFDIKPHNILLDENFTPKVSDFGLARLNQAGRDNNIATLTAARGTIGYMAPELFYKNIGGVSYKADVYSFGMLLLEMVGKRRNLNTAATDQSSAYFPSWVHNEVSTPGTPIAVGEVTEEEDNIAKKMVMVGLWCIQTNPAHRPPMNRVVEMLEGDVETLQLPPKPVLYSGETVRTNDEGSSSSYVSSEFTQSNISDQCNDEC
ncbi:unnamed protein product [Linum tenue]|uniref:Protein kinase domain-containing protein n=1 Tax=Linum tenue TaxID=586396 RepID=A0AAV0IHR5_9ROSI|nr:unnamed protein product [Linum tenue]